jgi:ribosomal protein S20
VKELPNIKSAIKRVKVNQTKALNNTMRKSALRTSIKKAKASIVNSESTVSQTYTEAIKAIDKAAAKNLIHKNTAARKKSQLAKALNGMNK